MSVIHIYQQPRLKSLFTSVSDAPFCYFLIGIENGTTIGFEYALPYFTNAVEYATYKNPDELDNYLESLVTSLSGGLFVTGILVNDKVDENIAQKIFDKLSKLGSKLKFGSSNMAKVCLNGTEKTIVLNNAKEYTFDDGEKLVAVPLKQYKSIFALYKLNIMVTAKSQKVHDIADAVKQYKFFEEDEFDDSTIQRNLYHTFKSSANSSQNVCIEFSGNILIFYPYLLSSDFKQSVFESGVIRALTSTFDDMAVVSVQSKDINDFMPPLIFYADNVKDDATVSIQESYYLLTKKEIGNVKTRSLYGKIDLEKLKPKPSKKPVAKTTELSTANSNQIFIIGGIAVLIVAIFTAYLLL